MDTPEGAPSSAHPPGHTQHYSFVVDRAAAGQRLDQFLSSVDLPLSRSQLQKRVQAGDCTLNGRVVRSSKQLKPGDRIELSIPPPEPATLLAEPIPLSILHEDDAVIVVDKPAGMVVHPAPGHARGTLAAALLAHCGALATVGGQQRPGIVHRLDKLTSGVLVATKSDRAHQALAAQFSAHSIERSYLAIVCGAVADERGTFDTLHGRHPRDRKRFSCRVARGRRAVTHFRVLRALHGATLVRARLQTGRTHQVRVHFAEHGHPLLGDPVYGRPPRDLRTRAVGQQLARQALHAEILAFDHPRDGRRMAFSSPLPPDFAAALDALGGDPETAA